jgi:hypothetical protein
MVLKPPLVSQLSRPLLSANVILHMAPSSSSSFILPVIPDQPAVLFSASIILYASTSPSLDLLTLGQCSLPWLGFCTVLLGRLEQILFLQLFTAVSSDCVECCPSPYPLYCAHKISKQSRPRYIPFPFSRQPPTFISTLCPSGMKPSQCESCHSLLLADLSMVCLQII